MNAPAVYGIQPTFEHVKLKQIVKINGKELASNIRYFKAGTVSKKWENIRFLTADYKKISSYGNKNQGGSYFVQTLKIESNIDDKNKWETIFVAPVLCHSRHILAQ